MKILKKDPTKSLVRLVYALLIALITIFALPKVISCILPFLLAWVVSLIIKPIVNIMEKARINRRIAVVLAMLLVVGALGGILYALSRVIINEVTTVIKLFKDTRAGIPVFVWELIDSLPKSMQKYAVSLAETVKSDSYGILIPAIKTAIPKLGGAAGKVPGAIVFTVVLVLAIYFISYDNEGLKEEIKKFVPPDKLAHIKNAKDSFKKACGGYIKAQLIIMCVVFCILFIGFLILGVNLAFILALLISFLDAIPVLGTGLILNPWAVISLIQGNYALAIGLVSMYAVVFITRQFLEPRVLSGQLGVHPIITLISMYTGLKLIGVTGMILGPLVAIIIINFIKFGSNQDNREVVNDADK